MQSKYKIMLSEVVTPNKPQEFKQNINGSVAEYPIIPRVGDKIRFFSYWWLVKEVYLYPSLYSSLPCVKVEFHSFGDSLFSEQLDQP
jgi:hypothetical protein